MLTAVFGNNADPAARGADRFLRHGVRTAVRVDEPVPALEVHGLPGLHRAQLAGVAALGRGEHVGGTGGVVRLVVRVVRVCEHRLRLVLADVEEAAGLLRGRLGLRLRLLRRLPAGAAGFLRLEDPQAGAVDAFQVSAVGHLPFHQGDNLVADFTVFHR